MILTTVSKQNVNHPLTELQLLIKYGNLTSIVDDQQEK